MTLLTEDQAKLKRCPVGAGNLCEGGSINEARYVASRCRASDCMAWRWGHVVESPDGLHPHTWPDLVKFHAADTKRLFKRLGFCGLAGTPEP